MDIILNPGFWLSIALILIFAELIIPGGVVIFMGAGALIVALSIWLGWVTDWVNAMTLYFVATLVLIVGLRSLLMKYAGGDFSKANTLEILDDFGETVTVVETIGPGEKAGRIVLRDTQWAALSDGSEIVAGESATIISLENVTYIVEKSGVEKNGVEESKVKKT